MNDRTIGRYRIIGILGEGGMGTVYEAEQDQPHRMVALKVIRGGFVSPELTRRFSRESEVLGRLQHPGIAQIYEAGTADGPHGPQPFFAMELVRGQPLTEYAATNHLGVGQRLELFTKICDAVQYAHRQGVIHRDLKPANILVDETGQPKILDFGVARLTDSDVQASRQTSVGEVIGTLQYMSPEQINADPLEIDYRSDVYTLGVILFELLTEKLPFPLARNLIHEAVRVILVEEPPRLSSLDRRLAGDVEIIVAKALEKDRDRRYHSADDLASDVRRFLRDEPIVARPASAIYQLRKFARRNRALVTGLAVAAGILVIGTAVSVWQAVRATAAERLADSRRSEAVAAGQLAERRRAQADSALAIADSARAVAQQQQVIATASAERATREVAKAGAINEFLQTMLASSDPANARGKELTVREVLDQAATATKRRDLEQQPEVRAAVLSTIGRAYYGLGLFDQARPHLDSAYAIRRRTTGAASLAFAQSADELGKLASATGDYSQAEKMVTQVLAVGRRNLAPDDDRVTEAIAALGDVRYRQGRFAAAESLYRQALSLARSRHGAAGGPAVADRLRALGTFLSYTDRGVKALPLLQEAVAIQRRTFGPNHPKVLDGLIGLSDAEGFVPDYVAAERTLREALPIARAIYGAEHPVVADVLSRLGTSLTSQERLEEAEPFHRSALAMRLKLLGDQHPDVQLARVELARLLQAKRRFAETDTLLTLALAARRATLGESNPAVASTMTDLGILAKLREDWPSAETWFRKAAPIWRDAKIEDQEITSLAELGWALARQDRLDEAETILNNVLARRTKLFGEKDWSVGDTYEKLTPISLGKHRSERAESLATKALEIRRAVYGAKSPQAGRQLQNLAFVREARGDTAGAASYLRESLVLLRARRPPSDPGVLDAERMLSIDLCATGAVAEGDSLIRAAIRVAPGDSADILPARLRTALGICLTRARRFPEAEPVLLDAEARLRAVAGASPSPSLKLAVTSLASLYEQWGKAEKAAEWRKRLP